MHKLALPALVLVAACGETDRPPDVPEPRGRDWRDEIIYQLLTDRFANGDPANDAGADPSCDWCFHGGDWRGVIERLDYLEALGVTTLWISPVVDNADNALGAQGYHGYWPSALDRPNPRFGTNAELVELVDACHARGMKVVVDLIVNHMGSVFFYDVNENGVLDDPGIEPAADNELAQPFDATGVKVTGSNRPAPAVFFADREPVTPVPFQNPEWYHRRGQIQDWNVAEQALSGDFKGGLRDLATERGDVRSALLDVSLDWVDRAGFDGFRIDAAKHVEDGFWEEILPAVRRHCGDRGTSDAGFIQFAEVFDGNPYALARYTAGQKFDSVLNFAVKYGVFDAVFKDGGPTDALATLHTTVQAAFADEPHAGGITTGPRRSLLNFFDNHDVPRFLNEKPDAAALHSALAFLLLGDGIPVLYYGTEQELDGGTDPANREDLWDSGYDQTNPTFLWIAELAELRHRHEALRRGATRYVFTTAHTGTEVDAGLLAFERYTADQRLLIVINTSDTATSQTVSSGNGMQLGFAPGTILTDLLAPGADSLRVGDDGRVVVSVPPRGTRLLAPRAL